MITIENIIMTIRDSIAEILIDKNDPKILEKLEDLFYRLSDKSITDKQFRGLHVYCQQMSDLLEQYHIPLKAVLKPTFEIPTTKDNVKQFLWKPVQYFLYGKDSTKKLDKNEIDKVVETINLHLAENPVANVLPYLPFPHKPKDEPLPYPENNLPPVTAF